MRPKLVFNVSSVSFFLLHLACLAVLLVRFSWWAVGLGVALYLVRMFAVTAGYHRYFSHRTYKMGRVPQFLMDMKAKHKAAEIDLAWLKDYKGK